MVDGRHIEPNGSRRQENAKRKLANEQRLVALGEAVDRKNGIERKPKRTSSGSSGGGPIVTKRRAIIAAIVVAGLLVGLFGGGYIYAQLKFNSIPKINVAGELPVISGEPFNILEIGSDSRAGLSGTVGAQSGATTGQASGQRSDSVKVMHVDPGKGTISVMSIPRDLMVSLLENQSLYGTYNRINVNFASGPSLLAKTITANFGIPINYVVTVSFQGLINAATAIGGVYLNFRYPSADPYSGLRIRHAGCQLVTGFQTLAVSRSRHFYYNTRGIWNWPGNNASDSTLRALGWVYDGTSDFGRINRQNAFMEAFISRAKGLYNPLTINKLLSKIPEGIQLDSKFSFNELVGLAVKFHKFNTANLNTYTIPNTSEVVKLGGIPQDVLILQEPYAQQMLTNMFGSQLLKPTNPPPGANMQPLVIPTITVPTTSVTTTTVVKKHTKHSPTTTTTNPTQSVPYFDPKPCTP
jgi:LCP family protein required for cell wall assembly